MGILATVFADAGQVSFNIARVWARLGQRCGVKRRTRPRRDEQDISSTDAIRALHEPAQQRQK